MTEKFKYVKVISFIALVMAIIVLLSAVIIPENPNGIGVEKYEKAKLWMLQEPENTIDAVFFGDSEVYSAFSPLQIWNDYGYACYSLGSASVRANQAYDIFTTMLEKQNPKIIFFETNFIFRSFDDSSDLYKGIADKFPVFKYHDVWKSYFNPEQKYENIENKSYKGYMFYPFVKGLNSYTISKTDQVTELEKANKKYFEKFYSICQERGIELVLISAPSPKNWDYKKHNGTQKLAKEYDLEYIDLNIADALEINWKTETRDKGDHVNHKGAVKVSKYIGKYLSDKGILEDHRGEEQYADWDELMKKYKDEIDTYYGNKK